MASGKGGHRDAVGIGPFPGLARLSDADVGSGRIIGKVFGAVAGR